MRGQRLRALQFMRENGSMTALDGFREFGIQRLASMIHQFRKLGFNIDSVDQIGKNRYGEPVRFSVYHFADDDTNKMLYAKYTGGAK